MTGSTGRSLVKGVTHSYIWVMSFMNGLRPGGRHGLSSRETRDPIGFAVAAVNRLAQSDLIDRVGLRRSAIYQRMSEGRFPKSRSLGPKCTVWVEEEIDAWIRSIADKPHRDAR